jgi:cysteine desulfuration protein SufE
MSTIQERKDHLIQTLRSIPDKDERLRYIVEQGKNLPPLPDSLKLDPFLVKGCISKAWLVPQIQNERLNFLADSEAMIVKGIIALLLQVYNGSRPEDILAFPPDFLSEAGVTEHLSMNRRNGLVNVLGLIQSYAQRMSGTQVT